MEYHVPKGGHVSDHKTPINGHLLAPGIEEGHKVEIPY